jgi:predicted GNAT family N-acyltransferase
VTQLDVRLGDDDDWLAIQALRFEVFVLGQGVDIAIEQDGLDAGAVHAVAYDSETLLGTGRMVGDPPGPARIGRMAVREAARGRGIGAAVLRLLEAEAARRGHVAVELHAQAHASGFYRRAGYAEVGEPFLEAGIAHVTMRRDLGAE